MFFTNRHPMALLSIALGAMLLAALLELTLGWVFNLIILQAEGTHLLGHLLYLIFAIFVQFSTLKMTQKKRLRIESTGSIILALALLLLAFGIAFGVLEHSHIAAGSGWALIFAGTLSFLAHFTVSWHLHRENGHPLVVGACLFAKSHVLLSAGIILGGVIDIFFNWEEAERAFSLIVAGFMAFNALRLINFNIKKLRHPTTQAQPFKSINKSL